MKLLDKIEVELSEKNHWGKCYNISETTLKECYSEIKRNEEQIAEYEEVLKTLRSQLYDKENKETVLTSVIKNVLDKWN